METVYEVTNQGTPFQSEPCDFPCFRNVGPPYISTLTLLTFIVGLPVWLFSNLVVMNAPIAAQARSPPQEHQPLVDPLPYLPVGYYFLFFVHSW